MGKVPDTWDYDAADADGVLRPALRVRRIAEPDGGKRFVQMRPDGSGGWEKGGTDAALLPYRWAGLVDADAEHTAVIVEGEKAADAGQAWADSEGRAETYLTWPGGSSAVGREMDWGILEDRRVVLLPDADVPGRKAAAQLADRLADVAAELRIACPQMLAAAEARQRGSDMAEWTEWGTAAEMVSGAVEAGDAVAAWAAAEGRAELVPYVIDWASLGAPDPSEALWVRDGGGVILPRAARVIVAGHPGGGKSWLAMMAAWEAYSAGGRVVWLDWESPPWRTAERMRTMGILGKLTEPERWLMLRTDVMDKPAAVAAVLVDLAACRDAGLPAVAVIDSASAAGIPRDSGEGVGVLWHSLVSRWAEVGATAIVIDHLPKNDSGNRGPVGSGDKLAQCDIALRVSGTPWTPTERGRVSLTVDKDRDGHLAAPTGQIVAAVSAWWEDAGEGERVFRWKATAPSAQDARAADTESDVLAAVRAAGAAGMTATGIAGEVPGRKTDTLAVVRSLARAGQLVCDGEVGSRGVRYSLPDGGQADEPSEPGTEAEADEPGEAGTEADMGAEAEPGTEAAEAEPGAEPMRLPDEGEGEDGDADRS